MSHKVKKWEKANPAVDPFYKKYVIGYDFSEKDEACVTIGYMVQHPRSTTIVCTRQLFGKKAVKFYNKYLKEKENE